MIPDDDRSEIQTINSEQDSAVRLLPSNRPLSPIVGKNSEIYLSPGRFGNESFSNLSQLSVLESNILKKIFVS
jgi:hypothetical protein